MDPSIATTLFFGFLLGMEHALEADHVVAVSTMVSQTRSLYRASLTGISWGTGHTLTPLVAGLVELFLKINIPEGVTLSLEFVVGVVLAGLPPIFERLLPRLGGPAAGARAQARRFW